ncbi:MAG: nicotinamide-nucleotide amidohydrolase family protein [Lentisphaerae bacterium]|nr:nicotinamide-nucleotide amidohydrolase family protein [Lentisphaerota bacterium]
MPIAVICTGSELLKGSCCNTNMQLLGMELTARALPPALELTVADHPAELFHALSCAMQVADTLIICGGLGPTRDDITLETVCRFFGKDCIIVPELKDKVESAWQLRHKGHCPKFQYKQAMIPTGGKYFHNPVGVASGIAFHTVYDGKLRNICLLPGPPGEFESVLHNGMLDHITAAAVQHTEQYTSGFLVIGTGESIALAKTEALLKDRPLEIACTSSAYGTRIFLTGTDQQMVADSLDILDRMLPFPHLAPGETDLPSALFRELSNRNKTIGCAESCTGGLVADSLVNIPGISALFSGGIVAYANTVKERLLGVSPEILQKYGAVSPECAVAMAQGACGALNCDCSVSTTGIAGPGGGTPEKPVGLVYIAAAVNGKSAVKELHLHGSRRMIREKAVAQALILLYDLLKKPERHQC